MEGQVFVCYAREDQDFVLKLARALKKQGVPVWLDQWELQGGTDWMNKIENALYGSTHLIVVLSPASMESREVRVEWGAAWEEEIPIVPVLFKKCKIAPHLRRLQHIDFTSTSPTDADAVDQVVSALERKEPTDKKKARQATPRKSPSGASPQTPFMDAYIRAKAKDAQGTPLLWQPGQRRASTLYDPNWRLGRLSRTPTPQRTAAPKKKDKKVVAVPDPEFYERPAWWASLAIGLGAGIGGEFLIDWLMRWVAGMFDYEFPQIGGSWLALLLAGLVWGLVYALVGALDNSETEFLILMPLTPYGSVFDFYEFGEALQGLLSAWPICFLASWGGANGLAVAAETFLSWPYATVAYIAFGILTLVCLGMFVFSASENIY